MTKQRPIFDREKARKEIAELVEKFKTLKDSNKLNSYSENSTKTIFITPLFRALGWDTENDYTEEEMIHEEQISRGRVDYSFRINGIPQFYVEAKAIKADISDPKYADQAINYAWHKGVTWAVLTDFEGLKVFNAEVKTSNHGEALFFQLNWNEYLDRFDQLLLLSRDSFEKNLLDKEAEKWGKKQKKSKVDDQLLSDLMRYREFLSKDIYKNNASKNLTEEDLDESVQRIIDRLIFIRTCEDRKFVEPVLNPIVREYESKSRGKLFPELNKIFRNYDADFNSKIFAPHLCENLEISNDVLIKVISGLYRTSDGSTHYDFSAIDADILGNIYEQYLSHILKKTDKRAKVESKEAHRKEQGIYYTPTYIVDYIVKNTLGELIKNKKPEDVDKIKVLDMACGSGSFLIKSFDLLDKYYQKRDKDYAQSKLDTETDAVKVTRKSKILKNNIYGVDLDPKAVEIAQLNLLLKAAETKHRLPNLQENIKCGNSLIGQSLTSESRAFEWKNEYAQIMQDGGFDVIIGNPPYVRQEELLPIKQYLQANYETYHSMADLFVYFFEREIKHLKEGGYFGMIVSNKWLKAGYGQNLRKFLSKFWIEQFIDFGDLKVFQDATTYPCIVILRKLEKMNPKMTVCQVDSLEFESLEKYVSTHSYKMEQKQLSESGWSFRNSDSTNLFEKLKQNSQLLKDYTKGNVYRGILTGLTEAFVLDKATKDRIVTEDPKSIEIIKPFLTGKEVRKYGIDFQDKYLIFTKIGVDIKKYPAVLKWLTQFKPGLEKRWDKGDYWYELRSCDYYELFEKPKIVYGVITTGPRFSIDLKGYYANNANFFIPSSDRKLLGILNSKLGWYLIANTCTEVQGGYQLIWKYFGNVPITKKSSPELEKYVDQMISIQSKLLTSKGKQTDERSKLETDFDVLNQKIDSLVYDLYGLSTEERQLVENSIRAK